MSLQNSWFMPYKETRSNEHVATLWRSYQHIIGIQTIDQLDVNLFDVCCGLPRVAPASLSIGMFWTRPDVWISVDKKNRELAATQGVNKKIQSGLDYLIWLKQVKSKFHMTTCEFSHEAHLRTLTLDDEEETDGTKHEGLALSSGERNYWLLAPGQGATLWDIWYEHSIGGIGWNEMGNLDEYDSKQAIAEYMPELSPHSGPAQVAQTLWEFAHVMKEGDVVFAKLGLHRQLLIVPKKRARKCSSFHWP